MTTKQKIELCERMKGITFMKFKVIYAKTIKTIQGKILPKDKLGDSKYTFVIHKDLLFNKYWTISELTTSFSVTYAFGSEERAIDLLNKRLKEYSKEDWQKRVNEAKRKLKKIGIKYPLNKLK